MIFKSPDTDAIQFPPIRTPDGRGLLPTWILYALIASMVAYLGTGTWMTLQTQTFNLKPLGEWFLFPLDIYHWPTMVVVWGLLLGITISVPLAISQRWGVRFGVLFAAATVLMGHLPFGAVLLFALMWVLRPPAFTEPSGWVRPTVTTMVLMLYLVGSCFTARQFIPPEAKTTWLLTPTLIAMAVCLVVLSLASVVPPHSQKKFWALLLGMLVAGGGVALLLFMLSGGDEALDFAYFDRTYGRLSGNFRSEDAEPLARDTAENTDEENVKWAALAVSIDAGELPALRHRIVSACIKFITNHPDSSNIAVVQFIQARAMDMRMDLSAWQKRKYLHYYDDVTDRKGRSLPIWTKLAGYSDRRIAVLGCYRAASYHAAKGEFDSALEFLRRLGDLPHAVLPLDQLLTVQQLLKLELNTNGPSRWEFDVYQTIIDSQRLTWTIRNNRSDENSNEALRIFLELDKRSPTYDAALSILLKKYPDAPIADNVQVLQAFHANDTPLLERFADADLAGDGSLWARYYLALATAHTALGDPGQWHATRAALRQLTRTTDTGPLDPWTLQAKRLELAIDLQHQLPE